MYKANIYEFNEKISIKTQGIELYKITEDTFLQLRRNTVGQKSVFLMKQSASKIKNLEYDFLGWEVRAGYHEFKNIVPDKISQLIKLFMIGDLEKFNDTYTVIKNSDNVKTESELYGDWILKHSTGEKYLVRSSLNMNLESIFNIAKLASESEEDYFIQSNEGKYYIRNEEEDENIKYVKSLSEVYGLFTG